MNTLLARYLDGDLTEAEAQALQALLASDKSVARELRSIESALDRFAAAGPAVPSGGFTDRVMAALPPVVGRSPARRSGLRAWAVAATVLLCLGIGWSLGRLAPSPRWNDVGTDAALAAAERPQMHWVRLVYRPEAADVRQVTIAGDFNGWDTAATPMSSQQGVWVAWLALPADVYEYQFVENGGERWVPDPLAERTRDDGFGGRNAVLELGL